MSFLSYLNSIADQPAVTYVEKNLVNLRNELREHPEKELHIKQQILICAHINEDVDEDELIDLAQELIAMDVERIYASDCFLVLASMYAKKNETTTAMDYYRKAIAANPEDERAIMELADLYEKQLDYDAAIAVYDYLDKECFSDIKDWMYRDKGMCYYNKQEYEKALEYFQLALELKSEDKDGVLTDNIGGCFFNMNNFTEAFTWFRKSLEKNPQSATAHYGLGLCYQHTDDGYRALHHYFEALKIKPDYSEAYNNIAAVTVNQEKDYKTGIEMLKKAIDTYPDQDLLAMAYFNLSSIYHNLCEFTLADHYKAEYMKCLGFDGLFEEDDDE